MHRLGERIKKRRDFTQIHLGELASQIGVSTSLLSQIENGKAFPSLFTLKKIAEGLKTTVGELIGENDPLADDPVIRWNEMKIVSSNKKGARLYLLTEKTSSQQMESYLLEMDKDAPSDGLLEHHTGQEFFHILEGRIEAMLNNETHVLEKGDSLYTHPSRDREIKNTHEGVSRVLWVVTPPL